MSPLFKADTVNDFFQRIVPVPVKVKINPAIHNARCTTNGQHNLIVVGARMQIANGNSIIKRIALRKRRMDPVQRWVSAYRSK